MEVWLFIILILLCVLLEGFFSGTEIAMVSLNRFLLTSKANEGNKSAKKIMLLFEKPSDLIVTTLLGTNICVVTSTTLATLLIYRQLGEGKLYVVSLIMSPVILIFGELIPKKIFQRYADSLALIMIHPLRVFRVILSPLIFIFGHYSSMLSGILGVKQSDRDFVPSRQGLRLLLENLGDDTDVAEHEKDMVENTLYLQEMDAGESMVPLARVDALNVNNTIEDAIDLIKKTGHSRIPVFENRVHNIVGIVHCFSTFEVESTQVRLKDVMNTPIYVPEVQPIDEVLFQLQKSGSHMAVVVDEYGGSIGIITMEDIFEEVVGEIQDEFDHHESIGCQRISKSVYITNSEAEVEQLNDRFDLNIPLGDYSTLSGYLLELFERIPAEGEKIEDENNLYIVTKAVKRKIIEVIIKRKV